MQIIESELKEERKYIYKLRRRTVNKRRESEIKEKENIE